MTSDAKHNNKSRMSYLSIVVVIAVLVYIPLLIHSFKFQVPTSGNLNSASTISNAAGPSLSINKKLEDRVKYLETKLNAYLAFTSDPFLGAKTPAVCNNQSDLLDLACKGKTHAECSIDARPVCLDDLLPKPKYQPCVVYDFGIRESPEFGLLFASPMFGCDVVAFDPSPITMEWYAKSDVKDMKNYELVHYGAGGEDEDLDLREYDWGQVSIIQYPRRVLDPTRCDGNGMCKYNFFDVQKKHKVPVRKLSTIMKGHGHERIAVLKLDIEGSEYRFLETMIDDGSRLKVDQLTLEWHHFDFDIRYGQTSNPQINVLVALLKERCGLEQFWVHPSGGWPSNLKLYSDMGITLYYTNASFKRVYK